MTASTEDIARLRSIVKWAKGHHGPNSGLIKEKLLLDHLEEAIELLDKPDSLKAIYGHLLAALANSYEKRNGMWIVSDRPTMEWAVEQIKHMQGDRPS